MMKGFNLKWTWYNGQFSCIGLDANTKRIATKELMCHQICLADWMRVISFGNRSIYPLNLFSSTYSRDIMYWHTVLLLIKWFIGVSLQIKVFVKENEHEKSNQFGRGEGQSKYEKIFLNHTRISKLFWIKLIFIFFQWLILTFLFFKLHYLISCIYWIRCQYVDKGFSYKLIIIQS